MSAVWKQDVMSEENVNMLYTDGDQYEDQWKDNKRDGTGKMIYFNKLLLFAEIINCSFRR